MKNFHYDIPTEVFFGQGQISHLAREIEKYGSRVLLVYGGGSIKKIGLHKKIVDILEGNNIYFQELAGVEPNPKLESVIEGVELVRQHDLDFILAVGGGSVIDCSKAIAASVFYEGSPWDLVEDNRKIVRALDLGVVLTMAATGSEMNGTAVISNRDKKGKYSMKSRLLYPSFSIMDPGYSYSVSPYQTASGTADIISHTLENYFSPVKTAYLVDRLAEAVLMTCFKYGELALEEGDNYEARSNLMWASSLAINGLLNYGKATAWSVHTIEHELTARYDNLPHGIGLAILTPRWMERVLNKDNLWKFVEYGVNVFKIDEGLEDMEIAHQAIERTYKEFEKLNIPMKLSDFGIDDEYFDEMIRAGLDYRGGSIGDFKALDYDDLYYILSNSL